MNSSLQTPQHLSTKTPRKLKLEKQVMVLTSQLLLNDTTEQLLALSEKYLSSSLFVIVKTYISLKNKHKQVYRYSDELKQLTLTIFFLGPKIYKFFQLMPGLNKFLFNFIHFKTNNFQPDNLDCILCADEMTLKTNFSYLIKNNEIICFNQTKTYEPTKQVLVLMIRDINFNWK